MSLYIWSDLHLGHANIIKYESRPFISVEVMNRAILRAWRETVKSGDTIINLGDVSFGINKKDLEKIIKNMPGHKILILGNHDKSKSVKWWQDVGFHEVYKYPIIYNGVIFSHEPIKTIMLNYHGHEHKPEKKATQNFVNVCVENIGFKPLKLEGF